MAWGVQQLLLLDPEPGAVRAARQFVTSRLGGMDDDALSSVELVVSELVTNAVLHAGTAVRLQLWWERDVVRVEVADGDAQQPAAKRYSLEAGTGRGLGLVDALAREWGVYPSEGGKTVWAEVALEGGGRGGGGGTARPSGRSPARSSGRPRNGKASPRRRPAARPRRPRLVPMQGGEVLVDVHLLALPVAVYARAAEHSDELLREFALILEREPGQGAGPPGRLLGLIREFDQRYGGFSAAAQAALRDAAAEGRDRIDDLVYQVPAEVGPACVGLERLLEEADAYCRAGDLLTLAAPPEALAFRRWFFSQFIAQTRRAPAVPWPEWVRLPSGAPVQQA